MAYIGFLKPSLYSFGILPEWSMCAWVSSIKSNSFTSNAKGDEFSHSSCAAPWYIPQSTKNFLPAVSTKKLEPVTVFVAPKKVIFIKIPLFLIVPIGDVSFWEVCPFWEVIFLFFSLLNSYYTIYHR